MKRQKQKKKKALNTGHLEVENTAAGSNEQSKIVKFNYVGKVIRACSCILTISAMTLMHPGLSAVFTTLKLKEGRKNPPSGTPTLLHQCVQHETLCAQGLCLQRKGAQRPWIFLWGWCQVEKLALLPFSLGAKGTNVRTQKQQLVKFHSVFKVDFSFRKLKDEYGKGFFEKKCKNIFLSLQAWVSEGVSFSSTRAHLLPAQVRIVEGNRG